MPKKLQQIGILRIRSIIHLHSIGFIQSLRYNHLNLPEFIEFPDCKVIEYTYDAGGLKLTKTTKNGNAVIATQDYVGGIEYKNGVIEAIYNGEGRLYFEDGNSRYEYNLKDHLGNSRVCFTDKDGNGVIDITGNSETNEVLEESHFYPFGMQMQGSFTQNAGRENKYLYNGKELQDDFGLGWYDYGARFYDPAIARWNVVDPLAEIAPNWTPYRYAFNNPISIIDPNGMAEEEYYSDGYGTWNAGAVSVDGGFTVSSGVDGEYEKNKNGEWVKVSEKGDNINVDFYHQENGNTRVTDRQGNWNIINDGRYVLLGEERTEDVDWQALTDEFYGGTGPERSLFIGNDKMNAAITSSNTFFSKYLDFKNSGAKKSANDIWFGLGVLSHLKGDLENMQQVFMGSFNFSFYKLGNRTLTIVQDAKTRTSANLHIARSYSREEGVQFLNSRTQKQTSTYQTYIFFSY